MNAAMTIDHYLSPLVVEESPAEKGQILLGPARRELHQRPHEEEPQADNKEQASPREDDELPLEGMCRGRRDARPL
eukprot:6042944-Pyramimonas_sp.AAC.1